MAAPEARASRIELSYRLSERDVVVEYDEAAGVHHVRLAGERSFARDGWEGAPLLPALHRTVLLPPDSRVARLTVMTADPVVVAEDIVPDHIRGSDGSEEPRDPLYYEGGAPFPPDPGFLTGNGSLRGLCLGDLAAMPFEWDSATGDLTLYREVVVLVDLEHSSDVPQRLRRDRRFSRQGYELDWVREHVVNPEGLAAYLVPSGGGLVGHGQQGLAVTDSHPATGFHPTDRPSLQGPAIDMVIITGTEWADGTDAAGDMAAAWQEAADWKTLTGTPTVVRTVSWIRQHYPGHDDPARIRAFLRDAYEKWGTDYVLLGGDDKVVPARLILFAATGQYRMDYPTHWWYASLEHEPSEDDLDPYYPELATDHYAELWVGRVPARDVAEVRDFVRKLRVYEHAPGEARPGSGYYQSFLTAASMTNSGSVVDPGRWQNGLIMSEALVDSLFSPAGFLCERLYPELPPDPVDCGGTTLPCWIGVKDALDWPTGYPSGRMTASAMRDSLDSGFAFFFHCEHSAFHKLGGPSTLEPAILPVTECIYTACTNCSGANGWKETCLDEFEQLNSSQGLEREMVEMLENGPEYTVGLTYGSTTGRHEVDSIAERLVRAPNGGAICMAAKSVSSNATAQGLSTLLPYLYFEAMTAGQMPAGVALYDALSARANSLPTRTWHFFGDPSMDVWTEEPGDLVIEGPDSISVGGPQAVLVTVTDGTDPVADALVTVSRADDVFVIGTTDEAGEVQFEAVPILHDDAALTIWAKARNFVPATDSIRVSFVTTANPFHPMVYDEHTWSGSGGQDSTKLEAGEDVDLTVAARNLANQSVSGGTATIFATPRVKVHAVRDSASVLLAVPGESIRIGANQAHPPAFADTFDLAINELGIRPEGAPSGSLDDDALYFWRGPDGLYRLGARYGSAWSGDDLVVSIAAEGGIEVVADSCALDGSDDYTVANGTIVATLEADGAGPDTLVFRASAQDWVVWSDSTETIPATSAGATAEFEFAFALTGAVPDRTRLGCTLVTAASPFLPTYSDFYLEVAAPRLVLNGGRVVTCTGCGCGCIGTTYRFQSSIWNLGSVDAEAQVVIDSITGSTGNCGTTGGWTVIEAGAELVEDFVICDSGFPDFVVGSLTIEWRVNGTSYEAETFTDLAWNTKPGVVEDLTVDSTPGGLRARWEPPGDTSGVQGYHVYLEEGTVARKVTARPIGKASVHLTDLYRFDATTALVDWRIGVTSVRDDWSESGFVWSDTARHVSWAESPGWPKRVSKGSVSSVVPFDIDADDSLEVIAGGQVVSIWKPSGLSATADSTGFLYEPSGTAVINDPVPRFEGDLAVAHMIGDTVVAIAGSYGDGNLYVVGTDGGLLFGAKATGSKATPTLADLDFDGDEEVLAQAWSGAVYAFRSDGTPYSAQSNGRLIAQPGSYNYTLNGIAVADAGEAHLVVVQATQRTNPGRLYAWEAEDGLSVNPGLLWSGRYLANVARQAAPVVADMDADDELEVVVRTARADSTVVTYDLLTGAREKSWSWGDPLFDTSSGGPAAGPYQPAVADLGGDEKREFVFTGRADVDDFSPETWVMVGYVKNDGTTATVTASDDILLPGRREEALPTTVGSPIVCDFDDDEKMEILVASEQGGLFAFEAVWDGSGTGTFTVTPEPDWPIVFAEVPLSMAAADIDADGMIELLVATDDGYVHRFDLPGAAVEWAMPGGDAARTGGIPLPEESRESGPATGGPEPRLHASGPNPFVAETTIAFQMPYATRVQVGVFDVQGRRVRQLLERESLAAGEHRVVWDGKLDGGGTAPAGTYFARIELGERVLVRKVVRLQ